MELLDVLDKEGNKTGITKDKDEIYKTGEWFRSVHIWIINDNNELLLQKRSPFKTTYPNLWAVSVSGHVISGESSIETVIREIKEELNLDVNKEECKYLFTIRRQNIFANCINRVYDDVYLLKLNIDINNTKIQESELKEIKYFNIDYLKSALYDNDPRFVPLDLEKEELFNYLESNIL